MQCPKCGGMMGSYNRNGVQIEQCSSCRGIFLDYGELEALTQLQTRMMQPQQPGWGAPHGGHHHGRHGHRKNKSFMQMLFSS